MVENTLAQPSVATLTAAIQSKMPATQHGNFSVASNDRGDLFTVLVRHDDNHQSAYGEGFLAVIDDIAYDMFGLKHNATLHEIDGVHYSICLLNRFD